MFPDAGHPDRRATIPAGEQPRQASGAHQPLHTLSPDPDPVLEPQLGMDARRPIDTAIGVVDHGDLAAQALIGERPLRRLARRPGV